ncbi:MAG: BON domain-containing protein [Nitrospirales bacterium]|nr:BON domain-containing protein [Nitrospirales bacterium]
MFQSCTRTFRLTASLLCLLWAGCTTIMLETGKKAFEDRTTEDQITDTKITTGILSRFSEKDKGLLLDVSADAWEQQVLLTGTLDSTITRDEILQLVQLDPRITAIYDEIQIVSPEEKERRRKQAEKQKADNTEGMGQTVDDFWIAAKIEDQLVATKGITSVNYRWRSVRNHVYLLGRARSQTELDKVLHICQKTKGVTSVKHFVKIKPLS